MTIFCYVCKRHVPVQGKNERVRLEQFHASGHSNQKVKALKKGLVGV